eukprot:356821-Chlamydomonas_euryale.AAC.3
MWLGGLSAVSAGQSMQSGVEERGMFWANEMCWVEDVVDVVDAWDGRSEVGASADVRDVQR